MLPKINRLTKKKEFDAVFKEGFGIKRGFLAIKTVKNALQHPRFGIVVSKKVSSKASVRNKIKRQLRTAVEAHVPSLKKSCDVVIISLPGIDEKEFSEIVTMVRELFKKLTLI